MSAETLDFPNSTFDAITISFGLRNVQDKEKALKEFLRVLKPGGFLMTNIIAAGGDDKYGNILHSLGMNYKRTEKVFSNGQANILYEVKK